jgi:ribonuclease-3
VPKDHENRYAPLEKAVGYRFRNQALLEEALTHPSRANEALERLADNQRLEFFGDAILDFLVSHLLYLRFPGAREGELTRMRAALVDEANLARVAAALGLGTWLSLGRGEEKSGGREKRSILADTCEALLAAVFLDGGITAARQVVTRLFSDSAAAALAGTVSRDYKTELQEFAQASYATAPAYELIAADGPAHDRSYFVRVLLNGAPAGEGSGSSKKEAQQAAARQALAMLGR